MTDQVLNYLAKGGLQNDLPAVMKQYEEFAGIDAFFNHSTDPETFYEWTVQGMIYDLLSTRVVTGHYNRYLLFLEQPYTATDASVRSDIMWVWLEKETIGALELKTDYSYASLLSDLKKLVVQLDAGTIKEGVMVFLVDDASQIDEWIEQAKHADAKVKAALSKKTLFAVGVVNKRA